MESLEIYKNLSNINITGFYKRPVVVVLISLMLGILTGYYISNHFLFSFSITSSVLTILSIIKSLYRRDIVTVSPLLLFYSLGILLIHPFLNVPYSEDCLTYFCDKGKFEIEGVIDSKIEKSSGASFIAKNLKINGSEVKGRLKVTVIGKIKKKILNNYSFKFKSKIKSIRNFSNPNAFNYKQFMHFKGIYGRTYVNSSKIKIEPTSKSTISTVREEIEGIIAKAESDPNSKSILKALLTGNKQIPIQLRDRFNRTGTGHILAVSGLHMGIIATFFFIITSFLFSFVKRILWNGNLKRYAALLILPPTIFFGYLSGMSHATQRAVIMVVCFVIALYIRKELDIISILAAAALLITVFFPPAIFSISFQFSFAAVLFIAYGLKLFPLKGKHYFLNKGITFFLVTLFATLGTFPLVMYYFNQFSIISLVANIVVVPFFSTLIIPTGLISVLSSFINSKIAQIFVEITLFLISKVINVINFFAELEWSSIITFKPSILELFLYYSIASLTFYLIKRGDFKNRITVFFIVILFLSVLTDFGYWINQRYFRNEMRITCIDVGLGSANLIELPNGKTVLIDGGGYSNNKYFDMGKIVIAPLLLSKKILTIDTIILSHANSDHLNGLIYIAENFNVKRLWSNGEASDTISYKDLIRIVEKNSIIHDEYQHYLKRDLQNISFEILYPNRNFKNLKDRWRDSNNNSLVVKVTHGKISVLFPGDIEHQAETELAQLAESIKSQILIVPHHGSKTSSSGIFINRVKPELAIISSGFRNRFGFPDKKVIKRYLDSKCKVERIDLKGSIILDISENNYTYKFCNNNK